MTNNEQFVKRVHAWRNNINTELKSWPKNEPKTFERIYQEFKKTSNPVTKAVRRQILINRLERK